MVLCKQIYCDDNFSEQNGLGLLLKERAIQIHKNSDHNRIGIRVNGVTDIEDIGHELDAIGELLSELREKEVLKAETKITKTIMLVIDQINYFFGDLRKTVSVHSRLIGTETPLPDVYNCTLTF
jgi:hypothetical protein